MTWIPLHLHSHYSVLGALGFPKDIVARAASYKIEALALTDYGNIFGGVEFYKACRDANIKPILGMDAYLAPGDCREKSKQFGLKAAYSLVLLAKNEQGYKNICQLSSIGYTEGFYYFPRIDKQLLEKHKEGIICLSSGLNSFFAHLALNVSIEAFKEEAINTIQYSK